MFAESELLQNCGIATRGQLDARRRFAILAVLCLAVLMVILDTTVVTVALPSMIHDLAIAGPSVTWMLNAYMGAFGGFLLLVGRLGDLYGRRRVFLAGIGVFTAASAACGFTNTLVVLIAARAIQGLGGAAVTAVSLSLITSLFEKEAERARAVSMYGAICAGGGIAGELLGGVLTHLVGWHWIFLINVPIGVAVYAACARAIPHDTLAGKVRQLDVPAAATLTGALTLILYVIVNGSQWGWTSIKTEVVLTIAACLVVLFVRSLIRGTQHLVPAELLRQRNFVTANLINALLSAGLFTWLVITALYLQFVLGYDPFQVGVAFLPAELAMVLLSAALSANIVSRFGTRLPLCFGFVTAACGLALFACARAEGGFAYDVLPAMLLLGIGHGIATTPLLMTAMSEVSSDESGVASGILNTSGMMGGALGMTLLVSLADLRSREGLAAGAETVMGLLNGYRLAFFGAAVLTLLAAALALLTVPAKRA